jgi:putative ABC transport system permease protein
VWSLALRFALHDRARALAALFGVVVAVFLIGQQVGIFLFLTGLMSALPDHARADLWITDARVVNANALRPVDLRVRSYVASVEGVARVRTLVLAGASASFPDGTASAVTLVGSEAPDFAAGPWGVVAGSAGALATDGAVSVEAFERRNLGMLRVGDAFEIAGRRVVAAAETRGARGFGGILLFTTVDRARALGALPTTEASALLVGLTPGADAERVRAAIQARVPGVRAWRPADLSAATRRTVLATSGIGLSVGTLIVFAVLASFATVGLTMYAGAVERLREYGTLKAIGATDRTVAGLIVAQAALYGAVGFAVGLALTEGFRRGVAGSGLLFTLRPPTLLGMAALTLLIATAGALAAVRRVVRLEPAEVFRG